MPSSMQAQAPATANPFAAARAHFDRIVDRLSSPQMLSVTHADLEDALHAEGMTLLRQLYQDHLDLRAQRELVREVRGVEGQVRDERRRMHRRLMTRFGPVEVSRQSYGAPGLRSLRPADADLNLPVESYSHPLRRLVAETASTTSFEETVEATARTTGATVAKRQAEEMTQRAARDFDAFYEQRTEVASSAAARSGQILVVTTDGKGVVVLHEALREATRKAAEASEHKLATRLSAGEKRNRKRMATVASVYTVAPFVRTPEEVLSRMQGPHGPEARRPKPDAKRVWASLEKEPEEVIAQMMAEAERRDPDGRKTWVAVVDGSRAQRKLVQRQARRCGVRLVIVLDIVHVIEYVWKAAWAFFEKGTKEAEAWVGERVLEILRGQGGQVAGGMRRSATLRGFDETQREAVEACASYLLNNRPRIRYDEYLAAGYPIASGVIEGACRHLIGDRLEITGARWGIVSAEAVLRLRSLRSSGDFDEYWAFHLQCELERNHTTDYAGGIIPKPATPADGGPKLRLISGH
jgi:hypothetical protein